MKSKLAATLLLFIAMCGSVVSQNAGIKFAFSQAGNYPGSLETAPYGDNLNQIVGFYVNSSAHAYIQTGSSFITAEPAGSFVSNLTGINNKGVAAGGYCPQGCDSPGGQHGYTFDSATGAVTTFDFPGQNNSTAAFGINDLGDVVGGYCPNSPTCPTGQFLPTVHGYLLKKGVYTLIDYPGAAYTQATGINNAGVIVGHYDTPQSGPYGFMLKKGVYTAINYPGAIWTMPWAINNSGVVAGHFEDQSVVVHGFLYQNGKFLQIDEPGAADTGLNGINDHNDLVGGVTLSLGGRTFKAVPKK